MSGLETVGRDDLAELAPALRRAISLDPAGLARIRASEGQVSVLVRLPFGVLVARTIAAERTDALDATVRASDLLAWLDADVDTDAGVNADADANARADPAGHADGDRCATGGDDVGHGTDGTDGDGTESDSGARAVAMPQRRDADWRAGLPPSRGWQRIDAVPDDVVRGLVRSGAQALRDAAIRDGVPGAQPRAEVADALLDSVVLTVSADPGGPSAPVTLRALTALTRMGFLSRGSHVAVDVCGRWIRLAAQYGSVYAERPGLGLQLL